jgi:hypothetical protein
VLADTEESAARKAIEAAEWAVPAGHEAALYDEHMAGRLIRLIEQHNAAGVPDDANQASFWPTHCQNTRLCACDMEKPEFGAILRPHAV